MKFVPKVMVFLLFILLFLFFFSFALKNTQPVSLHVFLQYEIHGPLVLMLLGFFLGGAVLGILAMTPTVFRYRRELNRSRQVAPVVAPVATQPDMPGL
jgi:lipopolysaccharide assembly protein A